MKRSAGSLLLLAVSFFFLFTIHATAQIDHIVIAAGTPEDHDLQAITTEQDTQKKLGLLNDFVQKYSANPAALAYGNWQIAQMYQATDVQKALDYGDKALVAYPQNLDILVSQENLALQSKNNAKALDYAVKGGAACHSLDKQSKPEGMSDEDFKRQIEDQKTSIQSNCDYLENSGYNVISAENDPKTRLADIETFTAAFPDSKFQEQISNLALDALSQLKDNTKLVAYGEKILASNPNSVPALLLLAGFYVDDSKPGSTAKAVGYAQKAVAAANADAPDADKGRKLSAGVAHSTLGYAYMKQEKTLAAIPELKTAASLLKGQDDLQYSVALYRLGFAYAKLSKTTEARDVLSEAVKIPGPMQASEQDLLAKVNAARAKGK